MSLPGKAVDEIRESDLQALVDNQVSERKYLEYKQCLPGNLDSDKKEFLADVTSFANAAGGDLIYGVKENDGVAEEVCGLGSINKDDEKQRLENMIRHGVQPRIPGLAIEAVDIEKKGFAIIIRIPRSWASPHRVIFKGHDKFYSRNSAGKYPMDVSELRAAFLLSETTAERIRNFRESRLARIVAGETPVRLYNAPKIVLHIVPIGAFATMEGIDLSSVEEGEWPCPIGSVERDYRYNFDGVVIYDTADKPIPVSYVQIFRNRSVEAVDAELLVRSRPARRIVPNSFEESMVKALEEYLPFQERISAEPPLVLMLSLLNVSGYTMSLRSSEPQENPIDRDCLLVPEILVDSFDCDVPRLLKPAFDAIWNACGHPRSRNYDENGRWKLKPE